jgi:hypothetical protein
MKAELMSSLVLQLDPAPGNARNSEGAFVTLNNGDLLFAYTKYVDSAHDNARSQIVCRTSADNGRTWSNTDRVLVDPGDALNVMSVSLLRLSDGRILFSYLRKEAAENDTVRCMPLVCYSSGEMASFSPPMPLTRAFGYYCINNDRIVQMQNGRIIAPVAYHRFRMPSHAVAGVKHQPIHSNPAVISFLFSDDSETWYESLTNCYCCFPNGRGLQEPGVIELNGGRLWSWMRTGWQGDDGKSGRQWQSFSDDGGQVWSTPEPSQFVSPCSPMSVKRIPATGDLLAVWNDRSGHFKTAPPTPISKNRTPLVAALSRDEGRSWEHRHLIEDAPDHGFCYTAIHFVDDVVLLAYCAGDAGTGGVLTRLRMRRFSLSDLYG